VQAICRMDEATLTFLELTKGALSTQLGGSPGANSHDPGTGFPMHDTELARGVLRATTI